MEDLSPSQRQLRSHIETGIAIASPFLDAILAVGERISRFAEPRDYEHYPVRNDQDAQTEEYQAHRPEASS